ncbi:MAG: single-stranded DNA-binding protein [Verrucomicrobia bacterium]|nr:single-stranded DNA-binding protein [Verrucomicrobiota bacterium]MBS0637134.1 single-stranded DNA-binding protein [Verrucomicrobiota bacterium]
MIFINVAGHLGSDPETRFTPNGQKVTTIRVATNIKRSNKEKTIWWRVTLWGDRFDKKLSYLKKGSPVMVWGEMGIPDIYQDKEGNPQTSFEIIAEHISFSPFGGKDRPNQDGSDQDEETSNRFAGKAATPGARSAPQSFAQDDDVPF